MYTNDRVTIGITCYNAIDTIGRAIKSAQAQEWADIEIVIVDDASTDGSPDYVAALIAGDERARLVRHEANRGAAAARNSIVENATGGFIVFFDDDDESSTDRVIRQLDCIKAFESTNGSRLVACYAAGERIYANGHVKPLPAIGSVGEPLVGSDVADFLLFYRRRPDCFYGSGTPTCALMARREVFLKLEGFDTTLKRVEDVDFAIRLALAGGYFIGTMDKVFLQHATLGTDKTPEANRNAEIAIARKHEKYLRSIGRYYYASHWPNLRFYHFRRQYLRFFLQFFAICLRHPLISTSHILTTGPKRLRHERKMRKKVAS